MKPHPLLAAVISILLSVLGQFALKAGTLNMTRASATAGGADAPFWVLIARSLLQPAAIAGLAMYAAGALLWIYVLVRWDVSKAYPMLGFGFVLTLAIGALFLGERVSFERWCGCLLVCAGLVLLVRS